MTRRWLSSTVVLCGMGIMMATGCGPDPKAEIARLSEERDRLRDELDNRNALLEDARGREEDAQNALASLRGQLQDAQSKLAGSGGKADADGWIGMPGFDMISIPGEVLFESGKATLRSSAKTTLDRLASDILGQYGDREIYVFGHTDNDPIKKSGWKDNWELGSERALTITRYLISRGLSPANIVVASCGEYRPRDSNSAEAGKKLNRRVEFYAVERRSTTAGTDR